MINSSHTNNKGISIIAALCLALLVFSYRKSGVDLYAAWQTDEYSHGIIIPFIAALIGWHRLTEKRPVIQPSFIGVIVMLISGVFLTIAELAAFQPAAHYGFILSLVGLSLAFLGRQATRTLAPAFIYLLFAIPLPHLIYSSLSQDLQLISSTLGVWFLEVFGIPVFQEGNVIDLGSYKLQVVEACNGLRYLFPLLSFGYLIAYLFEDRLWKRAIILLSAIPITIGMNSLRIAVIGVTVNFWGSGMAEGLLHDFEGWVVFMLCVALLMAEVWFFLSMPNHGRFHFEVFGIPHGKLLAGEPRITPSAWSASAISLLMAIVFGAGLISERTNIIPVHPPFATFPLKLDLWHGQPAMLDSEVLKGLQLSDYWLADYTRNNDKTPVNLYIAYYDTQRVGSSTHSPSSCIPGGGWQIMDRSIRKITLDGGKEINVSRFLIQRAGLSQLVYFWFDERGRNITDTQYAKWYLLVDSINMQRTDGALIRIVTPLTKGEAESDAEKRLSDFMSDSYNAIKTFIPGSTLPSTSSSL